MIVFIVFRHHFFGQPEVEAVFSSEEKAKAYIDQQKAEDDYFRMVEYEVQ